MVRLSFLSMPLLVAALFACGKPAAVVAKAEAPPPEPVAEPTTEPGPITHPVLPALDSYPKDVQRLAHLGRLWGAVRYLHPYLAYREIDWDKAGTDAIAAVSAATDDTSYLDAVRAMLAVLGDPATRVSGDDDTDAAARATSHRWEADDLLVVDMGTANSMESYYAVANLAAELAKARVVIFDLRDAGIDAWLEWMFPDIAPLLIRSLIEMPAERGIVHSGYRPQTGTTSGGYFTAFSTTASSEVEPSSLGAPERVVFLVGDDLVVPSVAVAMQASGQAMIVAPSATIGAEALGKVTAIELGDAGNAVVRTTESVFGGKAPVVNADATYEGDGMAVAEALAKGAAKRRSPAAAGTELPGARWRPDSAYADQELPSRELRILAAFRLWNVIDRFYPYLHLIGDWDAVLPLAITELVEASTAEDYARAIARVAAYIADTHTHTYGGKTREVFGGASPLGTGIVEGMPVVLHPTDEAAALGVAAGDIIETVDGQPIAELMDEARVYVAGSTEVVVQHGALYAALRGPAGSTVELGLRGPDGARKVTLSRPEPKRPEPSGKVPYRVLESGIGYADLRELTVEQVPAMFDALGGTEAIIFDMRGYPKGTAWAIAPRLDRSGTPTVAATFQRCLVSGLDGGERGRYLFEQPIPESDERKYTGRTYMLINHDTISQAEHTGLFFEAANGTELIGTNTSGANGDVTNMVLPGGIYVGFTGHDVRHADGRQLQRIGLVPHLRVAPTVEGIRSGDDEVLDAAIDYAIDRM